MKIHYAYPQEYMPACLRFSRQWLRDRFVAGLPANLKFLTNDPKKVTCKKCRA